MHTDVVNLCSLNLGIKSNQIVNVLNIKVYSKYIIMLQRYRHYKILAEVPGVGGGILKKKLDFSKKNLDFGDNYLKLIYP